MIKIASKFTKKSILNRVINLLINIQQCWQVNLQKSILNCVMNLLINIQQYFNRCLAPTSAGDADSRKVSSAQIRRTAEGEQDDEEDAGRVSSALGIPCALLCDLPLLRRAITAVRKHG